jgi:hypothetical protein
MRNPACAASSLGAFVVFHLRGSAKFCKKYVDSESPYRVSCSPYSLKGLIHRGNHCAWLISSSSDSQVQSSIMFPSCRFTYNPDLRHTSTTHKLCTNITEQLLGCNTKRLTLF